MKKIIIFLSLIIFVSCEPYNSSAVNKEIKKDTIKKDNSNSYEDLATAIFLNDAFFGD